MNGGRLIVCLSRIIYNSNVCWWINDRLLSSLIVLTQGSFIHSFTLNSSLTLIHIVVGPCSCHSFASLTHPIHPLLTHSLTTYSFASLTSPRQWQFSWQPFITHHRLASLISFTHYSHLFSLMSPSHFTSQWPPACQSSADAPNKHKTNIHLFISVIKSWWKLTHCTLPSFSLPPSNLSLPSYLPLSLLVYLPTFSFFPPFLPFFFPSLFPIVLLSPFLLSPFPSTFPASHLSFLPPFRLFLLFTPSSVPSYLPSLSPFPLPLSPPRPSTTNLHREH